MSCLFASDYGPPDPAFRPEDGQGALLRGFEAHTSELRKATNIGQLEAMERKLAKGESIVWCDQGYGWVYQDSVQAVVFILTFAVLVPYVVGKVRKRSFRGKIPACSENDVKT